jgi:hypothetical protein
MIRYRLVCDAGHDFESWFRDSDSFERQAAGAEILCPLCGSMQVTRGVMSPHVAREREGETDAQRLRVARRALRDSLIAGTEDVGARFPEEARRIEFGEAKRRPIRGVASIDEARALLDDGVAIFPLPDDPAQGH